MNIQIDEARKIKEFPLLEMSWMDIRRSWASEPYFKFYERVLLKIKPTSLRTDISLNDLRITEEQITKAKPEALFKFLGIADALLEKTNARSIWRVNSPLKESEFAVYREEPKKLWIQGYREPKMESNSDILTRLYIGLDSKKATDGFFILVNELKKLGVLDKIQLCLNLEEMKTEMIGNNTVVIYIGKSQERADILDQILLAYKKAKQTDPSLFNLTEEQKKILIGNNLETYRCMIDSNLTFVEMCQEEAKSYSWDAGGSSRIDEELGLIGLPLRGKTHLARLDALKRRVKKRLWSMQTIKDLEPILKNPSSASDGTKIKRISYRSLFVPALVDYYSDIIVKKSGKFEVLPE